MGDSDRRPMFCLTMSLCVEIYYEEGEQRGRVSDEKKKTTKWTKKQRKKRKIVAPNEGLLPRRQCQLSRVVVDNSFNMHFNISFNFYRKAFYGHERDLLPPADGLSPLSHRQTGDESPFSQKFPLTFFSPFRRSAPTCFAVRRLMIAILASGGILFPSGHTLVDIRD